MSASLSFSLPILLLSTILQATVSTRWPLFGIVLQLPIIVALAVGLQRGPVEGAAWAFVAGFFIDLLSHAPLGVTSLSLVIAVTIVAYINEAVQVNRFFLPLALAGLGMLIFSLISVLMINLAGYPTDWAQLTLSPQQAIVHAVCTMPLYWSLRGIAGFFGRSRVVNRQMPRQILE